MTNKAPAPPVVGAAPAPATDRHPALPEETSPNPSPTKGLGPTAVLYDPLPHEKVCDIYSDAGYYL